MNQITKHEAERIKVTSQRILDRTSMRDAVGTHIYINAATHDLIYQIDTFIAGLPDEEITIDISWPKGWWQAFKQRWFPAWLLRQFPVEFESIHRKEKKYGPICANFKELAQADPRMKKLTWYKTDKYGFLEAQTQEVPTGG